MHNLTSLQNIKAHTDSNSIPDGLVHISQNMPIDTLVNKLGKYIREDFYIVSKTQSGEKETILHYNDENYNLDFSTYLYPHFAVVQTLKRLLADKYSSFLHQNYMKQGVYALLLIDNSTLADFVSNESFWFDQNFARLQDGFDGFAALNATQQSTPTRTAAPVNKAVKQKPEKDIDFKNHDYGYTEYNRKHSLNGIPPKVFIGIFVSIPLILGAIFLYVFTTTEDANSDRMKFKLWTKETFSIFSEELEPLDEAQLQNYVGSLVDIPAGSFQMGSKDQQKTQPVHEVTLQAFKMGATEVTFEQWDACVADGACSEQPSDENWGRGSRPVINVSYEEIVYQYLPWLYEKTGYQFDLASEAQWEYAARGGTTSPFYNGEKLACGDANYGNFKARYRTPCGTEEMGKTKIVGSYAANPFGLFDMHGNVREITKDNYCTDYKLAPNDGSAFVDQRYHSKVIVRDGCYSDLDNSLKSSNRGNIRLIEKDAKTGFRLVLNPNK